MGGGSNCRNSMGIRQSGSDSGGAKETLAVRRRWSSAAFAVFSTSASAVVFTAFAAASSAAVFTAAAAASFVVLSTRSGWEM